MTTFCTRIRYSPFPIPRSASLPLSLSRVSRHDRHKLMKTLFGCLKSNSLEIFQILHTSQASSAEVRKLPKEASAIYIKQSFTCVQSSLPHQETGLSEPLFTPFSPPLVSHAMPRLSPHKLSGRSTSPQSIKHDDGILCHYVYIPLPIYPSSLPSTTTLSPFSH